MPGTVTTVAEVTHVSKHGFRLLLDAEALLVPFEHFPWFRKATIEQLSDVQRDRGQSPISFIATFAGNAIVLNRDLTPLPQPESKLVCY